MLGATHLFLSLTLSSCSLPLIKNSDPLVWGRAQTEVLIVKISSAILSTAVCVSLQFLASCQSGTLTSSNSIAGWKCRVSGPAPGPVNQNMHLNRIQVIVCSLELKKHTALGSCVYASLSAIDVCLEVVFETRCCRWTHVLDPRLAWESVNC